MNEPEQPYEAPAVEEVAGVFPAVSTAPGATGVQDGPGSTVGPEGE